MKSAGISSDRLFCWFLPWLCCIGPTAVAAELHDPGHRLVRFPPVVGQTAQPKPEPIDQPPSDIEEVSKDSSRNNGGIVADRSAILDTDSSNSTHGSQDQRRAVRFPGVTSEARRIPQPPMREAPQRLPPQPVNRPTFSAFPPLTRRSPMEYRPQPRFVNEWRAAPADNRRSAPTTSPSTEASNESEAADLREPIGEKPPDDTNDWLARDTTLLLKPGKAQTEIGVLYTRQEVDRVVILPTGAPVLERIRSRSFIAPFSIRYGWSKNVELFSVVPFGVSAFERDNVLAESTEEAGALADISAGFVYQLPETRFKLPDSTVNFSVTMPTSSSSVSTISGDQATLGNGVWKVGVGLNFVESYDPIVLFGGLGYQYQFAEEQQGIRIARGDLFNFYCGMGLAVSDDFSLSTQVSGFLQDKTSANDMVIPNSDIEPLSVRMGFVRRLTKKSRVQPYVEFGLTRDAPDAMLGLRYIHDE